MDVDVGHGQVEDARRLRHALDRLVPVERHRPFLFRKAAKRGEAARRNALPRAKERQGTARGTGALPPWLRRSGYYGLALLFVGVTALARWAMPEVLRPVPFLVFYLAWVGAAAFGGLGPGLLATVASWLCINMVFDSTPGQIDFTDPASIAQLSIFLGGGLAVSAVAERMRRSRMHERRQSRELADINAALRASEEKYR